MKVLSFLISALFIFSNPIYAQGKTGLETLCGYYTPHIPDADVEYQDGFDVRGDSVVSADLDDNRLQTPHIFRIPLHVEQLEILNLPADSVITPELSVGEVIVDLNADTITFNGQRINQNDLEVLCLEPDYQEDSE